MALFLNFGLISFSILKKYDSENIKRKDLE